MKRLLWSAVFVFACTVTPVLSASENGALSDVPATSQEIARLTAAARAHLDKLRARMTEIQQTKDIGKRVQLLQQHMKALRVHLNLLANVRAAKQPQSGDAQAAERALDPMSNELLWHGLQMVVLQLEIMEGTIDQLLQQQEQVIQVLRTSRAASR